MKKPQKLASPEPGPTQLGQPQPYADSPAYESAPTNPLGLTAFIFSILGFITCGFGSLISLPLSVVGIRNEPRGTAVAGLILSILGLVMFTWALSLGFGGLSAVQNFQFPNLKVQVAADGVQLTEDEMRLAAMEIGAFWKDKQELPNQEQAEQFISGVDGWGQAIQFHSDAVSFWLVSAGPDTMPGTTDDIKFGPFFSDKEAREVFAASEVVTEQPNEK